jgi:hypothetical protein
MPYFVHLLTKAVGVDLSAASLAIFVELPPDASWLCQAEDRLHRHGQQKALQPGSLPKRNEFTEYFVANLVN